MAQDYTKYNAKRILTITKFYIRNLEQRNEQRKSWERRPALRIKDVCDNLSIFDWWNDNLSLTQLKDMKKFLEEAIKLGFDGYVCFKVGATGCANGMWAYKELSTTGFSPDGEFIYKSFTPAYNYWDIKLADGVYLTEKTGVEYNVFTGVRALEKALVEA